jgi:hypothetical protein
MANHGNWMVAQRGGHQHGACLDFSDSAVHGGEISRCGCVKWAALRFAAVRYSDSNALQQIGKALTRVITEKVIIQITPVRLTLLTLPKLLMHLTNLLTGYNRVKL